jgi:two-component sensor histidine kinase
LDVSGKEHWVAVQADITEQVQAQEQIQASLREKEVLLQEVHHRVKNNLQVISSLLYLQATKAERPDTRELFRSSRNQIHSMALVHEKIYGSGDLARVDFHGYVRDLTTSLLQSYGAASAWIDLALNVEQLQLGIDLAIPCGLIINELVTNALRHAFHERQQGHIGIDFQRSDGYYHLQIKDDGRGLPPAIDPETTPSLGLQLVSTLVEQLEGSLDIQRAGGTRFNIRFPADAQPEPLAAPADLTKDTVPA